MRARSPLPHVRLLSAITAVALAAAVAAGGAGADHSRAGGPVAAAASSVPTTGIEAYAGYEPQRECAPRERAGVRAFRALVLAAYPASRDGGIVRDCAVGGRSEHKEGRAWDWMLDAGDPDDAAAANEVIGWLLATDEAGEHHALARRLGVMYIIWDGRIWSASEPGSWRPYQGVSPHDDHVHISFTADGADGVTSFWEPVWEPEIGAPYPATTSGDPQVQAAGSASGVGTEPAG